MEEIKEELIELGFKTRSAGIVYWSDVIEIIESDNKIIPIMKIYEIISKKRDTSISRVERAMRYSMKEAKLNIQKEYKCKDKISNMKFISLLRANKIKDKGFSKEYIKANYIRKVDLASFISTELTMIENSRKVKGFLTKEQCDAMEAVYNAIYNLFLEGVEKK